MANNDKIKQIITNLQILSEKVKVMEDAEIYPVSFFSESFDLIQQIQSDFHTLEADQVELFATQMKKHQALILSIHQQMRNIEETGDNLNVVKSKPMQPITKTTARQATITAPTTKPAPAPTPTPENVVKKPSLLSRLIHKEETIVAEQRIETKTVQKPIASKPVVIKQEVAAAPEPKQTALIIEEPIVIPKPAAETPKQVFKSTTPITTEQKKNEPTIITPTAKTIETKTGKNSIPQVKKVTITTPKKTIPESPKPTVKDTIEEKVRRTIETVTTKDNTSPSVNDLLEKKKLSDLRKAFSLNDRFRYRRELFGGSEDAMNKAITALNNKESIADSIEYLENTLHWDIKNPTVKEFLKILELRYI